MFYNSPFLQLPRKGHNTLFKKQLSPGNVNDALNCTLVTTEVRSCKIPANWCDFNTGLGLSLKIFLLKRVPLKS